MKLSFLLLFFAWNCFLMVPCFSQSATVTSTEALSSSTVSSSPSVSPSSVSSSDSSSPSISPSKNSTSASISSSESSSSFVSSSESSFLSIPPFESSSSSIPPFESSSLPVSSLSSPSPSLLPSSPSPSLPSSVSSPPSPSSTECGFNDILSLNSTLAMIFWSAGGVTLCCCSFGFACWCLCCFFFCKSRRLSRRKTRIYTTRVEEISPDRENVQLTNVLYTGVNTKNEGEKTKSTTEEKPIEKPIEKSIEKPEDKANEEKEKVENVAKPTEPAVASVEESTTIEATGSKVSSSDPGTASEDAATAEPANETKDEESQGKEKQEGEVDQQSAPVMTTDSSEKNKQPDVEQQDDIDAVLNAAMMDLLTLQSFGVEGNEKDKEQLITGTDAEEPLSSSARIADASNPIVIEL